MARHIYEYDVDLTSDTAAAYVIKMAGCNRRVLEVGAGPGSITKHLVRENRCDVVAIEREYAAIEKLKMICPNVYELDLNKESWPVELAAEDKFDVVIAADVLEHTYDPLQTLTGMKSLLQEDGEIILSLPHIGHSAIIACMMNEDFEYRDCGLLDRTHIRFFGIKNVNQLHEKAGLAIVDAKFVFRTPADTEFAATWMALSSSVRNVIESNPFGHVYQIVTKAKLSGRARNSLDLMTLSVQNASNYRLPANFADGPVKRVARNFVRNYASDTARKRLRSVAARLGVHI